MIQARTVTKNMQKTKEVEEIILAGQEASRPIFIIGAPRSATSALTWAIGQHPNIQPMPETAWIASFAVGAYLSHLKGSERGLFSHLSNANFPLEPFMVRAGEAVDRIVHDVFATRCGQFYGNYKATGRLKANPTTRNQALQLLRAVDDPKRRWIDGTPLNTQYIWVLSRMFPEARFLHSLRRPDEVATSLEGFDKVGADPQPLEAGLETWRQHTENAWFAERAFASNKVFRVDFSRLTAEPEGLLREIMAFLGEDFSDDCLLPFKTKLNSSEVDARREANLSRLREMEAFQTADAFYAQIHSSPIPEIPEQEAEDVLRQRFLDYCHERSLV